MKEVQILTGISGLIMGAGRSQRFGKSTNKIFELVGDRPVIAYTISAFEYCDRINEIVYQLYELYVVITDGIGEFLQS